MKTIKLTLISLLYLVFWGCNGQTQKENSPLATTDNTVKAREYGQDKPEIRVKVNRQYDDKGRIVKFDSTYSYFYSGPKGRGRLGNDSVFNSFHSFFEKSYPNFMGRYNNSIFFNDSLFKYDFFNDDYFQKRFQLNEKIFENMYQQMDSIKRDFLKYNYPNGYQKKNRI